MLFPPSQTLSYDGTAGVLHFNPPGIGVQMAFGVDTGYTLSNFATQAELSGTGTEIVYVACFAAGTRILTIGGEVAVESLRHGDAVPTLAGAVQRVRWIGRTRIDLAAHPNPDKVATVRIRAHAFGKDRPHRDLRLSPDHAVWIEDALVPVHLLVNGASIARERGLAAVEYWHVELDAHDVLLAEGLAAESYLDTGNRALFAGEPGARKLAPDLMAELSALRTVAGSQRDVTLRGAIFALVLALVLLVVTWLRCRGTEIVVTDKRLLYKCGLVTRHTVEMNISKIESVDVQQGIVGRLLDYGTVLIRGTGETLEPLRRVVAPLALRNAIAAG